MAVAHSPKGYTGTVDQVAEAMRFSMSMTPRFRVAGPTDWLCSASATNNLTVNIAAGAGCACGIYDSTSTADSVLVAPNNGATNRFDAIVATFDWSARTVTFQVVTGTTAPPPTLASGGIADLSMINYLPGLRYDALLAVVRVRPGVGLLSSGDITDCRLWGDGAQLAANSGTWLGLADLSPGHTVAIPNIASRPTGTVVTGFRIRALDQAKAYTYDGKYWVPEGFTYKRAPAATFGTAPTGAYLIQESGNVAQDPTAGSTVTANWGPGAAPPVLVQGTPGNYVSGGIWAGVVVAAATASNTATTITFAVRTGTGGALTTGIVHVAWTVWGWNN